MRMRSPNPLLALLAAGVLAFTASACSGDDSDDTAAEEVTTTTEAETTTTAADEPGDIVSVALEAGSFTTLADLLTQADLVETLSGDGPFTVFAPTDEAFEALPEGALEAVGADPDLLAQVLTYHVIDGEVMAADVTEMDGQSVETLSGDSFEIQVEGETVTLIDGAGQEVAVVDVDVEASNGVIHVVESVLLPTELDL